MGQIGYVLLGTALVVGLVQALVHARQDVYYIPLYGVGMAVGAFVVAVAGIGLGWRTGRFGRVALTMLAVVVALVGVVSFGVLLLALVLACLVLVVRASRARQDAAATGAGVLLGLGVSVLALVALSPPLVDCADGSAGENVFMGLGSNSASGSASGGADGQTNRGRAQGDTYVYSYTCRSGKLVQFAIRSLQRGHTR
jgi:MFS family permease